MSAAEWARSSRCESNSCVEVWRKSSRSAESGNCLEWHTSTRSSESANCVEVAEGSVIVRVRDSKDRQGPQLAFPAGAWAAFVAAIKAGEMDRPGRSA